MSVKKNKANVLMGVFTANFEAAFGNYMSEKYIFLSLCYLAEFFFYFAASDSLGWTARKPRKNVLI